MNNSNEMPISKAFTCAQVHSVSLKPGVKLSSTNRTDRVPKLTMIANKNKPAQMPAKFHNYAPSNRYEHTMKIGDFSKPMTGQQAQRITRSSIVMNMGAKDVPQKKVNNAYIGLNAGGKMVPKTPANNFQNTRRSFLNASILTLGSFMRFQSPINPMVQPVFAETSDKLIDVYFGVGCFWHTQHEFIEAEKNILKRGEKEYTSLSGFAGGNKTGKEGAVCYHNLMQRADYGSLGHGEVVGMKIPEGSYDKFADEYFKLFDKNGDRPDKGDRGSEYRHMVGLPGGINSPLFAKLKDSATKRFEIDFKEGKGDDADNLGKRSIWVYDSEKYPFYQAEVYHQYHDGFMPGEQYGRKYNELAQKAYQEGRIKKTLCPDIV